MKSLPNLIGLTVLTINFDIVSNSTAAPSCSFPAQNPSHHNQSGVHHTAHIVVGSDLSLLSQVRGEVEDNNLPPYAATIIDTPVKPKELKNGT